MYGTTEKQSPQRYRHRAPARGGSVAPPRVRGARAPGGLRWFPRQRPHPAAGNRKGAHQVANLMDEIVSLAKRRGIAFQSSEIYGGLRSSWDYGPIGVELKNNIKQAWWRSMVQQRDDIVGLDAAVIMS